MANVESSLLAVPINHMFNGILNFPIESILAGSFSHLEDTIVKFLSSGFGISSNDKNSAK